MKVLFLHPNFPAQFKHSCKYFAEHGVEVTFICQTHYGRKIEGVNLLVIKYKGGHDKFLQTHTNEKKRITARANDYRHAFATLKKNHWNPDVVVSHTGWGCGINIREIWANAKIITYLEWWFDPYSELMESSKENKYMTFSDQTKESLWARNIPMAFEMALSDKIVSPTNWQKQQLPKPLRDRCDVIHDGVDPNMFNFNPSNRSQQPKLTYGTRGMEPVRCFPEFVKCLPIILKKWPELIVEIAGIDEVCYGGYIPTEGSWGRWAIKYLRNNGITNKVKWLGRLDTKSYINWLQSSWCHIYLTQPYVASWSLLEAIFCQTPLVINRNGATEEFACHTTNAIYIDSIDPQRLSEAISSQLRNPERWPISNSMITKARQKLFKFETSNCLEKWLAVTRNLVSH